MKLYNTLHRQIEDFTPAPSASQSADNKVVTLYTCGPTVYNYAHIGNLRAFTFYDTLRRTLEAAGYDVRHVMNITDVGHLVSDEDEGEDKLEKGAAREGKTVWEVAAHYTEAFKQDMRSLNILPPNVNPHRSKNEKGSATNNANPTTQSDPYARATDFVPEQIEMVTRLLERDYAYITEQAVYFDVTKLPDYGKLSGQSLASKEIAARASVVTDPDKRSPHDFAVWFFCVGHFADHTMRWSSAPIAPNLPDGFPGWHLECSAIIHALLDGHTPDTPGHAIDIHAGGVDHIGTHHPNEMAQTQGAFGHELARFWVHNEFILVDGAKMSKSKGNAYTLSDITSRKDSQGRPFHPLSLRLLYLRSHYRSEINFTWDNLNQSQDELIRLYEWADLIHQVREGNASATQDANAIALSTKLKMEEDLSSPAALVSLFVMTRTQPPEVKTFKELLEIADALLGLGLSDRPDITPEQKALIAKRETIKAAAKAETDKTKSRQLWTQADTLRDTLRDTHHLTIDDTPTGPRWRRTTL